VPNIRCYHCKKEGHTQRFCPERQNDYNSHRLKEGGNEVIVQDVYEYVEALMVGSGKSDAESIMDSGCSFHMTPNKLWFEKFIELQGGSMLLGNNKPCKIQGIGSIKLKLHDGSEKIIQDVRFVPNLNRNLISLGKLDRKGYLFRGENGTLEVMKDSRIVMRGVRKHGLYSLKGEVVVGLVASVSVRDMSRIELWHRRLGHVSESGLV